MLLCADIGNSHTTLGLLDDGEVADHWRVATDERRTADEWGVLLPGLLRTPPSRAVLGVAVCSHGAVGAARVARHDAPVLRRLPPRRRRARRARPACRCSWTTRARSAPTGSSTRSPPRSSTTAPRSSSTSAPPPPSTWSAARGEYVGGAISPGIEISLEALGRRGAQLRKVELLRPRSVIAKNTVEALQCGVLYGFASQVDGMVDRMTAELGLEPARSTWSPPAGWRRW